MCASANLLENPLNITILKSLISYQLMWMEKFKSLIQTNENSVNISSLDQNDNVEMLELYINGSDLLMGVLKTMIQGIDNRINNEETESHRNTVHIVNSAAQNQISENVIDINKSQPSGSRTVNTVTMIPISQQRVNQTNDDTSQSEQAQIININVPANSIDKECSLNESGPVQDVNCTAIQEVNHINHEALHPETNEPSSNATPTNDDVLNQTQGTNVANEQNQPAPNTTRTFAIRRKYMCAFNEREFIGKDCYVRLNRLRVDRNSISERHRHGEASTRTSYHQTSTDDTFEDMEFHRGKRILVCYICNKRLTALRDLRAHLANHGPRKLFACEVSAKVFSTSSNLTTHLRLHTGDEPFSCKICGKQFKSSGNLTEHVRIHTGEKPFPCKICGRQFTCSSNLTRHVRIHTGEKRFCCKICGNKFTQMGQLTSHVRIHTGEKPFSCQICGMKFIQANNLTYHLRLHTGEKPFLCKICGKQSTSLSNLTKHVIFCSKSQKYMK